MNTNETPPAITPLELATLSTRLVMAGLLKPTGLKEAARQALNFIDVCKEATKEAARKKALPAKGGTQTMMIHIRKWRNEHGKEKPIPLKILIRAAGAGRVNLTHQELRELNESRDWNLLSDEEKNRLRFLLFAPAVNRAIAADNVHAMNWSEDETEGSPFAKLEVGEKEIAVGFGVTAAIQCADIIPRLLKERAARQRRAAANAPKKKRKPQRRDDKGRMVKPERKSGHDNAGQFDRGSSKKSNRSAKKRLQPVG